MLLLIGGGMLDWGTPLSGRHPPNKEIHAKRLCIEINSFLDDCG
jgi:hypothetical protein